MKKIIKILIAILLSNINSFAQITFEGSEQFGRIFDITYHPTIQNKLFAVTMGNHIVSSNDNGLNWEVFYTHTPNYHHIQNLKFLDTNTISFNLEYGFFDNHLKLLNLQTNQIIKTYTLPIPQNATRTWITDYSIYSQNSDILLVSQGYMIGFSNYYIVYYSTDGGNVWNTIYSSINSNSIAVNTVAISPDNPQKLFIARGNGPEQPYGGLLISTNAGQTWTEQLAGTPIDPIAFNPQNPNNILIGTDGTADIENLFRSNDGGLTWQSIAINWVDYALDNIVHIAFNLSNPNNIMVLEENQVIYTTDNFQTHINTVHPDEADGYYYGLNASFNPFNSNEILVSGNYHPLVTLDGGVTFTKKENPFFLSNYVGVFKQNNIKRHLYYGVQFGYVHKNLDTTTTNNYNILPLNFFTNESTATIYDPNLNGRIYNVISSFSGSNLLISDNHGTDNISIPFIHQYIIDIASQATTPNKIWASFFESDLQGNSGSILYEIDFSDSNNITQQLITLPVFNILTSIYINPNNYLNKFIALGSRIYKTNDNGQSWQISSNGLETILNITDDIIFKIVDNPLNAAQLTIATSQGIFTSYDFGNNWQQISDDLVENVLHSPFNNGVIIASSYTREYSDFFTYYSTDMGLNWQTVPNNILYEPNVSNVDYNFISNGIEVYLATSDLGIMKCSINLVTLNNPSFNLPKLISVYPNPAKNILNINTDEEISKIEVYDLLGKKVDCEKISTNSIELTNLANGIYTIKIITRNGKTTSTKFIKD